MQRSQQKKLFCIREVSKRMDKNLITILIEDIEDHAGQLRELSETMEVDAEQVDYHHTRLMRKIELLKGAIA